MELTATDIRFIEAMRKAVKEKGRDYRYHTVYNGVQPNERPDPFDLPACEYTIGTEGACLIGRAIHIDRGEPYTESNDSANEVLGFVYRGDMSPAVRLAAQTAQRIQDKNGSWGKALDVFHASLLRSGYMIP